jgi:hypothetical protein
MAAWQARSRRALYLTSAADLVLGEAFAGLRIVGVSSAVAEGIHLSPAEVVN